MENIKLLCVTFTVGTPFLTTLVKMYSFNKYVDIT